MIDIKEIRENPDKFKKAAKDKHFNVDIDKLLEVDSSRGVICTSIKKSVFESGSFGIRSR